MLTRNENENPAGSGLSAIELERIITLNEASRLSSQSVDTLRRRHRDKIIQLSLRRQGMRVKHALMLV
jgi:hypothetical protein